MRKSSVLIAYFFIAAILFSGCQNFPVKSSEEINVTLPEFKNDAVNFPEFSRWHIQIKSETLDEDFFTTESAFQIEVKTNQPVCVVAQPIILLENGMESDFFKPAGGLYPYFCETENLEVTWESGFSASLMMTLFQSGKETGVTDEHLNQFISQFNWKKFQTAIEESIIKNEEKFYNPWQLDSEKILENLCLGIFQTSYLNNSYVYSIPVSFTQLPEDTVILSSFIPENDFIYENQKISLKKNQPQLFFLSDNLGANLTCTSAKKVSLEVIYMPIFLNDL